MSDSEEADQNGATGGFLAKIAQFDGLGVPGAAKAVTHLVTGSAQAASAWIDILRAKGQQRSQRIRDDTAARTKISAAVAKAASQAAAKSPAIVNRAVERLYAEQLRYQENRESVAVLALGFLNQCTSSVDFDRTQEPSTDWLNVFSTYAEKASSQTLREHWAQILAGEIRSPGSFSLATLLMVSIIDMRYAEIMTRARRWVAEDWVILLGPLTFSPRYDDLLALDSIGFLRIGSSKSFHPQASIDPIITPFVNTGIAVFGTESCQIPGALLTIAGKEMLQIMPQEEDYEMIRHLATEMKSLKLFNRVQIGTLRRQGRVVTSIEGAVDV
jgi:hypothetical protein